MAPLDAHAAMILPPADRDAEDAFVGRWRDHFEPIDLLEQAVCAAVGARRLLLARRLVSLLPEREAEPAEVVRARSLGDFVVLERKERGDTDAGADALARTRAYLAWRARHRRLRTAARLRATRDRKR